MKNLMIYIHPSKSFTGVWGSEAESLVKVQIDNSLEMGWKDIVLVTNFDYEYRGIKSVVLGDENYYPLSAGTPSKINAIVTMFEKGLIEDDLYWFHDFDAFQLNDLGNGFPKDKISLTKYGVCDPTKGLNGRWSTGSIFFGKEAKDVFKWIQEAVYKYEKNEEVALLALLRRNRNNIRERVNELDISYNFATRRRDVVVQYEISEKPLKVIHFHPYDKRKLYYKLRRWDNMEVCVQGKSPLGVLVTDRLKEIFACHSVS